MTIADLTKGESAVFINIHGGWGIRRRLEAMGLRPGIVITKISDQIFGGPIIIKVGKIEFAIGRHMARRMIVQRIGGLE
ncbi:MAG: ferrous iron transport protein A [Spirochaetales bacterium]|nr:ferrous iron transport protein A [Spirochaetales bacterium]